MESAVANYYQDKSVFVTGGTGFLGSALIEKLLRCCPGIKNIYLIIRSKRYKTAQQRLPELLENSVFDRLKEEGKTDLFKKIIAIEGDVGESGLGLLSEDRQTLIKNVNVVFHSAATLDFEDTLKNTATVNLLGTRRVVELCQSLNNFECLVHVSSAYVNSDRVEAYERVYTAPTEVEQLLKKVKKYSTQELIPMTEEIIGNHPNSYTFTKNLAEHEVVNANIPAVIIRPSMIVGAWREPIPGWTISKNGPQGFLMGASKGVVRRLPVAENLIYDYIPIDIVVNSLVVGPYAIKRDNPSKVPVYHLTSSTCTPFRWAAVTDKINGYLHRYPLASAVWYPGLKLVPSLTHFRISAFFVHMIPAYILDTIMRIAGGRPILVRLHTNVNKSLNRLEKFIFTEWKFHNTKTLELHETLNDKDKDLFTLDIRPIDWETYFVDLSKGVRVYLNKEPLTNLKKALRKDKILLVLHLLLQALILSLIWWLFKSALGMSWTETGMIVPLAYFIMSLL